MADFAVQCLSNPATRNAVTELGGPEALSPVEIVRIFEEVAGRPFFEMQFVPEEALQARKAGATNPVELTFTDLTLTVAQGDAIDISKTFKSFRYARAQSANTRKWS